METTLDLPLLREIVPSGIEFPTVLCVEFDPQAVWFEVALTLVAQALRAGVPTDLHLFQRSPRDVVRVLQGLGLEPAALRSSGALRIIDTFHPQTGLGPRESSAGPEPVFTTMQLSEWGAVAERHFAEGIPSAERGRFHIDDNMQALARYNSEDEILDHWRTRVLPMFRASESILLNAISFQTLSPSFYPRFESLCDGVLEVRVVESGDRIDQRIRLRSLRGGRVDTRWRALRVTERGEATLDARKSSESPLSVQEVRPTRRLVAIMFTDLVEFTRLAQRDEHQALRVRAQYQSLLRPLFSSCGGREVKSMGDGFLVTFSSAVESVRCALAIQHALALHNRDHPTSPEILVRIGVHVGDVVEEGEDLVGDAVNVGSRIEAHANPGGVCVSGQVVDQIGNKLPVRFEPLGAPPLKNVDASIALFKLVDRDGD